MLTKSICFIAFKFVSVCSSHRASHETIYILKLSLTESVMHVISLFLYYIYSWPISRDVIHTTHICIFRYLLEYNEYLCVKYASIALSSAHLHQAPHDILLIILFIFSKNNAEAIAQSVQYLIRYRLVRFSANVSCYISIC